MKYPTIVGCAVVVIGTLAVRWGALRRFWATKGCNSQPHPPDPLILAGEDVRLFATYTAGSADLRLLDVGADALTTRAALTVQQAFSVGHGEACEAVRDSPVGTCLAETGRLHLVCLDAPFDSPPSFDEFAEAINKAAIGSNGFFDIVRVSAPHRLSVALFSLRFLRPKSVVLFADFFLSERYLDALRYFYIVDKPRGRPAAVRRGDEAFLNSSRMVVLRRKSTLNEDHVFYDYRKFRHQKY